MLGIGTSEFLVIIVVAILVLGPEHLPRVLRTVQKVMSDFRRISTDFQRAVNLEAHLEEFTGPSTAKNSTTKKKKKKKAAPPAETPATAAPAEPVPPAEPVAPAAPTAPPSTTESGPGAPQSEGDA